MICMQQVAIIHCDHGKKIVIILSIVVTFLAIRCRMVITMIETILAV